MLFLNPLNLFLLAGIAAPILIHLLARRKGQVIYFSSIRFLHSSQRKTSRRRRIEEWLILSLRVILLALLLSVLAQPISKAALFFSRPGLIVFLLDDSLSMSADQGRPYAALRDASLKLLESVKNPTAVSLVFLSGRYVPPTRNLNEIRTAIAESRPGYGRGYVSAGLAKAFSVLGKPDENRLIYFFTDFQKSNWPDSALTAGQKEPFRIILVDVGGSGREDVGFESIAPVADSGYGQARLKNWGGLPITADISLDCDGRIVRQTAALNPGAETEIRFPLPAGTIRIAGNSNTADRLETDNRYYLNLEPDSNREILIAGAESVSGRYLRTGLSAAAGDQTITSRSLADLRTVELNGYSAVFLFDPAPDKETADKISAYVRDGGHVVFFAGDRSAGRDLSQTWPSAAEKKPLLPVTLKPPETWSKPGRIAWADSRHPLFLPFGAELFDYLKTLEFRKTVPVTIAPGQNDFDVLLKLDNNAPLLCEGRYGQGKVLFFACLPDESWTTLPTKPFYPVLLNRLAQYFSAEQGRQAIAGEQFSLRTSARETVAVCTAPSGAETKMTADENGNLNFTPFEPGFWQVRMSGRNGVETRGFAVNTDQQESDPERISSREISGLLPGKRLTFANPSELSERHGAGVLAPDLAGLFLKIALLLLLTEILVSNLLHYLKIRGSRTTNEKG